MSERLMRIEFKPRAVKDLDALDSPTARRILDKIRGLESNLAGDCVIIYRIKHRSRAYS